MLGLNAPTSDLLLRLLLLGLSRTSLKSSLRSASTRGILLGARALLAAAAAVAAPLHSRSARLHRAACRAAPAKARGPRTERIYRARGARRRGPGPIALLGEVCF